MADFTKITIFSLDAVGSDYSYFFKYLPFEHKTYHSTHTWTLPAHIALLTGKNKPDLFHIPPLNDVVDMGEVVPSESIATDFKKLGFVTKAKTGGGFMGKYFGWGKDWDQWDDSGYDGSPVEVKDGEFWFLHTYFVHDWFKDGVEKEFMEWRQRRFDKDVEFFRPLRKLYLKRLEVMSERLKWLAQLDKTLVILLSDHAELFGEDGCVHHGDSALGSEKIFKPLFRSNHEFDDWPYFDINFRHWLVNKWRK